MKKNILQLFQGYELLADRADAAFAKMEKEHGTCIRCERHCSDCCHAVFGLFLIEAAYLKQHFDQMENRAIRNALLHCGKADREIRRLEVRLEKHKEEPQMQAYIMATERIRCPLLDENQDCILYSRRPITCRVYGIPTRIHGRARVCGKAGFESGKSYPVFDLDGVYRDLFHMSRDLLDRIEGGDPENGSLLISLSKAISTPLDEIVHEGFGGNAGAGSHGISSGS